MGSKERSLQRSCAFLLLSSAVVCAVVVAVCALLLLLVRRTHTHAGRQASRFNTHNTHNTASCNTQRHAKHIPLRPMTPTHTVGELVNALLKNLHTHGAVMCMCVKQPQKATLVYKEAEIN